MRHILILVVLTLLVGCTSTDVSKLVDAGAQLMISQSQQSAQQNYGYRYPPPPRYYYPPPYYGGYW